MYRCDTCNAEYKTKPDYCDCGNDTFTYIEGHNPEPSKEFLVKKVISVVIFVICILLSVLVWEIKLPQPEQKGIPQTAKKEKQEKPVNIPEINDIWNSTPPVNQPSKEEKNIITVYEKPKRIIKNLFSPQKEKAQTKPTNTQTAKPVQKNKPQQNTPAKPVKMTPPPAQQTQKNTQQKVQTTAPSKSEPQTQKPVVTEQKTEQKITPAPKPAARMDSGEWDRYKNSLRYALLSKLDVVKVTGEGDCAVAFSFDSNGKLLNRRFIYQSTNKSLNDQVYLMLMKLPVFNPPPKNYRGETVKMKFYINNGYYEISFLN